MSKTKEAISMSEIKDLIHKFKEERLLEAETPFSHEAEIWAGLKQFMNWLDEKNNINYVNTTGNVFTHKINTNASRKVKSRIILEHWLYLIRDNKIALDSFLQSIIIDYINLLIEKEVIISNIAFSFTSDKIYPWIVLYEEEKYDTLIIQCEGEINPKYSRTIIDATIVEESDNIQIPTEYIQIIIIEE